MDNSTADLEALRSAIAGRCRSAWVRVVVAPVGDEPSRLLALRALVGPKPDGWEDRCWRYGQCTFVASRITVRRFARWFDGGEQDITLGALSTTIDIADGGFSSMHVPSLARYSNTSLPWPSVLYTPPFSSGTHVNHPQGYLVGDGSTPSFPAFGSAYNAFFFDDFALSGVGNPQLDVAVHVVDGRARIRRVRIRPASVDVWLGGSALAGTCLELNGAEYRTTLDVGGNRASIPLPEGLPSDAWLWLKSGAEWLDFRPLSPWGGALSPDIKIDFPPDPAVELGKLATRGEGAQLEYKEKLPDTRDEKRNVFKTVVAFANGGGGTIVFGIEDETKTIKGLDGKPSVQRRRLTDLLRDLVRPAPSVRVEDGGVDGRQLLVLHVQPGGGTIYGLVLDGNKPEYYVRRDGTTFYARPEELEAVVAQHVQPLAPAAPWRRSRL
jgi:hypothetical protein